MARNGAKNGQRTPPLKTHGTHLSFRADGRDEGTKMFNRDGNLHNSAHGPETPNNQPQHISPVIWRGSPAVKGRLAHEDDPFVCAGPSKSPPLNATAPAFKPSIDSGHQGFAQDGHVEMSVIVDSSGYADKGKGKAKMVTQSLPQLNTAMEPVPVASSSTVSPASITSGMRYIKVENVSAQSLEDGQLATIMELDRWKSHVKADGLMIKTGDAEKAYTLYIFSNSLAYARDLFDVLQKVVHDRPIKVTPIQWMEFKVLQGTDKVPQYAGQVHIDVEYTGSPAKFDVEEVREKAKSFLTKLLKQHHKDTKRGVSSDDTDVLKSFDVRGKPSFPAVHIRAECDKVSDAEYLSSQLYVGSSITEAAFSDMKVIVTQFDPDHFKGKARAVDSVVDKASFETSNLANLDLSHFPAHSSVKHYFTTPSLRCDPFDPVNDRFVNGRCVKGSFGDDGFSKSGFETGVPQVGGSNNTGPNNTGPSNSGFYNGNFDEAAGFYNGNGLPTGAKVAAFINGGGFRGGLGNGGSQNVHYDGRGINGESWTGPVHVPAMPHFPQHNSFSRPHHSQHNSMSSTNSQRVVSKTGRTAVDNLPNGTTVIVPGPVQPDRVQRPSLGTTAPNALPAKPQWQAGPSNFNPVTPPHNSTGRQHNSCAASNSRRRTSGKGSPIPTDLRWGPQDVVAQKVTNGADIRTTLMVRGIPKQWGAQDLVNILNGVVPGKFDFTYVRIDFQKGQAVGYSFVNFTDTEALSLFVDTWLNRSFPLKTSIQYPGYNRSKCAVSYANIQGLECLIKKFRNSSIMDEAPGCRPKLWDTPTNGTVGREVMFPGVDNLAKHTRSSENATFIGLYSARGRNDGRDGRHARSQFDRGTSAQIHDEQQWFQYHNGQYIHGAGPVGSQPPFVQQNHDNGHFVPMGRNQQIDRAQQMQHSHQMSYDQHMQQASHMGQMYQTQDWRQGRQYMGPAQQYNGMQPMYPQPNMQATMQQGPAPPAPFGTGPGTPFSRMRTQTGGHLGGRTHIVGVAMPTTGAEDPANFGQDGQYIPLAPTPSRHQRSAARYAYNA